jgi:tetratricopeptide (TPR) repeat protein
MTSFVSGGLQELAETLVIGQAHHRAHEIGRMLEACLRGNYQEALRIERGITVPDYYPEDIKAEFRLLRNLGKGVAHLAEGDSKIALESLEEVVKATSSAGKPAGTVAVARLLAAWACLKQWQAVGRIDVQLIRRGLGHIDEAIQVLPSDAEHYALRAAFRLGLGEVSLAEWDLDLAISLDPQHTAATAMQRDLAHLRNRSS